MSITFPIAPAFARRCFSKLPAVFLLALSVSASANENLDEIIVTTKGYKSVVDTLQTATALTREDIETSQAKDLTTLIDQVSGVNITDNGGRGSTTGVFIRGANTAQTIVLIDGVRVGSATLGEAALNTYPLEAIQRIEVVKGPLSGIYGADAAGGVIQLFTQSALEREDHGSFNLSIGDDSLTEVGLNLYAGNSENNAYLSAQHEESDGIDRTSIVTGGNEDKDGFEQTGFSAGGRLALGDASHLGVALLYSDNYVEFDNTFGDDTGFFTDTKTFSSALNLNSTLSEQTELRLTLGHNSDEAITPAFASELETERNSAGIELRHTATDSHTFTIGADFYEEDVRGNVDFPVDNRDNKGLFALWEAQMGKFGLAANARYDDNSAYGSTNNASVAVSWLFNDQLRAVASYGSAFVAPSFNFLYFPFFGNPDLLPEESDSFEIGLRGMSADLQWRVAAFRTDYENLFSFDPNTFLAANIGRAEIEGIEAEVGTSVRGWDLNLNATLLSAKNVDTGVDLDGRAGRTVSLRATRQWQKLDVNLSVDSQADRYSNNGTELSSFVLLNLGMGYRVSEQLSLRASLKNALDKEYTVALINAFDRYHTEGRKAKLELRYQF